MKKNLKIISLRKCLGCGEKKEKKELLRLYKKGSVLLYSPEGTGGGRGYYICPNEECFIKAVKRLIKRSGDDKNRMIRKIFEAFALAHLSKVRKPLKIKEMPSTYKDLWNIVKNMI